jgi:hypothetical protein
MEHSFITSAPLYKFDGLVINFKKKKSSVRIAVTEFDPEIFQIITFSGDLKHKYYCCSEVGIIY